MSNIIPPLLSNSPPPMIETVVDDEDDEFGNFAVVSDLSYDEGLSISPLEQVNIKEIPEIPELYVEKDFQDKRKDSSSVNEDCASKNDNEIQCNGFQDLPEKPPNISKDENTDEGDFNNTKNEGVTCAAPTHIEIDLFSDLNITDDSVPEVPEVPSVPEVYEVPSVPEVHEVPSVPEVNEVPSVPEVPEVLSVLEVMENKTPKFDDDFADFHAFTNTPLETSVLEDLPEESVLNQCVAQNYTEDDDFGDFNNYSIDNVHFKSNFEEVNPERTEDVVLLMFPHIEEQIEDFHSEYLISDDHVFGQLKDVTDTLALSYQWNKSNSQNFLLQALSIDTRNILYGPRWNESMPRYAATLGFTPLEPTKSETHGGANGEITVPQGELVEQSEIPLAEFDWVGSGLTNPLENSPASTMLLDLEQLVASLDIQYSSTHSPKSQNSPPIDDLDDWEFWLRLTPKKIIEKQTVEISLPNRTNDDKKLDVSVTQLQTNSDTDSIKSLKFIQNDKTEGDLDDFTSFHSTKNDDDFHCFQSNKTESENLENWSELRDTEITNQSGQSSNENFENWISLRETHISNVKTEKPSWLKPTILTPDLSRKEFDTASYCEEEEEEDEFTEFQTGNIDQVPVPEAQPVKVDHSKIENENHSLNIQQTFPEVLPVSIIPESIQPLGPSILQPLKVENAPTTINWPDPGVTDEELHRFDMFYQPNVIGKTENSKISTQAVEDDDWSDFVSNQTQSSSKLEAHALPKQEMTDVQGSKKDQFLVKPPLPFSQNGFATALVSNQYVVLNHVPSKTEDVEDEWSDFVSSQPPQESPSRVPKPTISKLNLDWNGPPQFTSWSASITPNIITNPVAFESFQNFTPLDSDLLKNRNVNKKNPNVMIQPKKNTVPSIATVPDLEFIAPKNRTWKK